MATREMVMKMEVDFAKDSEEYQLNSHKIIVGQLEKCIAETIEEDVKAFAHEVLQKHIKVIGQIEGAQQMTKMMGEIVDMISSKK